MTAHHTPTLITLSGLPGAGKDTAADLIQSTGTFVRVSFSDPVRSVAATAFGFSEDQLRGRNPADRVWRETPDPYWSQVLGREFTPRDALTTVGTDLFRVHFCDNMWVHRTMAQVSLAFKQRKSVLITDLRHVTEFLAVRDFTTKHGIQWTPIDLRRHQAETIVTHRLRYYADHAGLAHTNPEEWCDTYLDAVIIKHRAGDVLDKTHRSVWEHILFSHKLLQVQNNSDLDCLRTSLLGVLAETLPA